MVGVSAIDVPVGVGVLVGVSVGVFVGVTVGVLVGVSVGVDVFVGVVVVVGVGVGNELHAPIKLALMSTFPPLLYEPHCAQNVPTT